MGGMLDAVGGASPVEGMGGSQPGIAGMGPVVPAGPYDARVGPFKMLVYSKTAVFRHDAAIATGKTMLQQIATEQGFEVVFTEDDALITLEGLSQFEIVFFLNTTGDIFDEAEQQAYQQWMTEHNGAFAGVHSATDTENGWEFYSEVTGQYYDGHTNMNTPDQIQLEATMLTFPALAGLPNPWSRNEEWYKFNNFQSWSMKPGFTILGRKAADAQPIMWIREWGNFRAFYTAIGHDGSVFDNDNDVKRHLTGGIMWAVRREALIQ
jgi:type 1 glutamine amidotransferase